MFGQVVRDSMSKRRGQARFVEVEREQYLEQLDRQLAERREKGPPGPVPIVLGVVVV
jgi:hypothetical protein